MDYDEIGTGNLYRMTGGGDRYFMMGKHQIKSAKIEVCGVVTEGCLLTCELRNLEGKLIFNFHGLIVDFWRVYDLQSSI